MGRDRQPNCRTRRVMGRRHARASGGRVSLVEYVRPRIDKEWLATNCEDAGCSLSLGDLPRESLLVRADQPAAGGVDREAMCDFIWLDEQNRLAAIELKGRRFSVSHIVLQLQQGADQAGEWLSGYGGSQVKFRPILACRGKVDKRDRRELKERRANWIGFRGSSREIKVVRCGSQLRAAL